MIAAAAEMSLVQSVAHISEQSLHHDCRYVFGKLDADQQNISLPFLIFLFCAPYFARSFVKSQSVADGLSVIMLS